MKLVAPLILYMRSVLCVPYLLPNITSYMPMAVSLIKGMMVEFKNYEGEAGIISPCHTFSELLIDIVKGDLRGCDEPNTP